MMKRKRRGKFSIETSQQTSHACNGRTSTSAQSACSTPSHGSLCTNIARDRAGTPQLQRIDGIPHDDARACRCSAHRSPGSRCAHGCVGKRSHLGSADTGTASACGRRVSHRRIAYRFPSCAREGRCEFLHIRHTPTAAACHAGKSRVLSLRRLVGARCRMGRTTTPARAGKRRGPRRGGTVRAAGDADRLAIPSTHCRHCGACDVGRQTAHRRRHTVVEAEGGRRCVAHRSRCRIQAAGCVRIDRSAGAGRGAVAVAWSHLRETS